MNNPNSNEASWNEAQRGMVNVGVATILFALWHSLLCSRKAKGFARQQWGEKRGAANYRAFFMLQSAVTTGALFATILKQPHRTLYSGQGFWKWMGWLGQGAAIVTALSAVRDLDEAKFLGIKGVRSLQEKGEVVEAEAQGPELDENGQVQAVGLYRFSRHPMEWAPIGLLFFSPVMKTNWLVFDILAAFYSWFGAVQEEKRLLRKSGESYARYQKQVPFLLGKPKTKNEMED